MTIGQVINNLRMLGSIAFVKGHLLAGGLCYFAGGILSFPALYRSPLAEIRPKRELLSKLQDAMIELFQTR
ncbi:hypothetical protein ACHAXN_008451, partial [Cyclotella atomus]